MPEFDTSVDVDVDDFILACNHREIKEIIDILIVNGHLSPSASNETNGITGKTELDFSEKVDKLKKMYYSITKDDEEVLEKIFNKYL